MKKTTKLFIPLFLLILSILTCVVGTFAWFTYSSLTESIVLKNGEVNDVSINVYRGFDYDLNGVLDSREEKNDDDLSYHFMAISTNDRIESIMEGAIITYRIVIRNDNLYGIKVNPYFIFSTETQYRSCLFNLNSIAITNHSIGDNSELSDGFTHIQKDPETDLTNYFISEFYDEANNLITQYSFDTILKDLDGNLVTSFTNGIDSYELLYNSLGTSISSVKLNGLTLASEDYSTLDLDLFYHGLFERFYDQKNMALFAFEEYYDDRILVPSESEYYVDLTIRASSLTEVSEGVDDFIESDTYHTLKKHYNLQGGLFNHDGSVIDSITVDDISYSGIGEEYATPFLLDISNLTEVHTKDLYEFNSTHAIKSDQSNTSILKLDISYFSFDVEAINGGDDQ